MTNKEYVEKLTRLARIKYYEDKVWERRLKITVARDYYKEKSASIIAFEGSPPRLEVYVRLKSHAPIVVSGKVIRFSGPTFSRAMELQSFLADFIEQRLNEE